MKLPSLSCAQALRDGGIDAMAALDHALVQALKNAPEAAHAEMKLAIGHWPGHVRHHGCDLATGDLLLS